MEVAGWKQAIANEPLPDIAVLFFFSGGIHLQEAVGVVARFFSCALPTSLSGVPDNNMSNIE